MMEVIMSSSIPQSAVKIGVSDSIYTTLQVLFAIPTVVYGYFSAVFLSSSAKQIASFFGLSIHSESALVAGLSVGIMVLPFIISLLEDAIRPVPRSLCYGFMALGEPCYT
uniref:Uncharacterized protein n=1 Tax=Onchocerca volvulus TaxID=6282 RepID=A0A8R1TVN9_ONCVO